ncbi:MAG: hypothetical protein ABI602_04515 [Candidatus Saccharibacteria bacterium]
MKHTYRIKKGLLLWGVLCSTFFGVALSLTPAAFAINPTTMPFQGKVVNASGINVADANYSFTFKLYSVASGGTSMWGETQASVPVASGVFQVNLGSTCSLFTTQTCSTFSNTAIDFNASPTLYLGVTFNGDAAGEMAPRMLLGSVPFAFNADKVGGLGAAQFVQLSVAQQTGSINVSGTITSASTLAVQGASAVTLGSTTNVGAVLFKDGTVNNRLVTLNSPALTASYTLTLPTTAPALSQCLQSGASTASQLIFGSCGGTPTLAQAYTASGAANPQIVFSATGGGLHLQDAAVSVGGNLLSVASNGGATNFLAVTTAGASITGVASATTSLLAPLVDVSSAGTLSIGTGTANAITLGKFGVTTATAGSLSIDSGASVPTADQVSINNTSSSGVTTNGVNGISVNYKGGAAAVESSGMRIDYAPGTTTGGTWSGLRIVANATGPVTGVTAYGIKLEGPTSPGAGTEVGMYVGSGWDIGADIQSGGMQLAAQADPAVPAAGNLRIYAKDIAGRIMPKWLGPSGVDTPFQANLGFNRVSWTTPAGGTVLTTCISTFGSTFTNVGTVANPTPSSGNILNSVRRVTFSTGTTAAALASHRQSTLQVWRGNSAGLGGFFYTIRFGTSTLAAGNRSFVGMSDSTAAPTNVDPTTSTAGGKIGLAINASTGNWNLINNISGSAPTVLGLGANFPVDTTSLYELVLFSAPNGSSIGYRVTNTATGNTTSGSLSTNIPSSTTFMAPLFWITNNATAAAAIFNFSGWYLESDN